VNPGDGPKSPASLIWAGTFGTVHAFQFLGFSDDTCDICYKSRRHCKDARVRG